MEHKFGVDEITTKIAILQEEFAHLHDYNPIDHLESRVKSPQSIREKAVRRGIELSIPALRQHITDIAGVRVTCSFTVDVYRVFELLRSQTDLTVLEVEDYIARPKPNGYRSLHALVEVPVHLSDRVVPVGGTSDPHCRHGLLGQPRAQDLLQVPRRRPTDAGARARRGRGDGGQSRRADGTAAQANPSGRTSCRSERQRVSQLTLTS